MITVCLPTYNGASFLNECLNSIRNQTFTNWELIVSDDGSSDSTISIVEEFQKSIDQRVRIISHKRNGLASNWNNCMKHANGKYIKFVFQDDLIMPDCLEKMIHLMESNQTIGLVFSKREIIHNNENNEHKQWLDRFQNLHTTWNSFSWKERNIVRGTRLLKDQNLLLEPLNKIGEPTAVMFRKDCLQKVGVFRNDLVQMLDWEYWMRIMKFYKIGFIDIPLVAFRLHDAQESAKNGKKYIDDYEKWPKIMYYEYFFYLNILTKYRLFKKYNPLVNKIKQVIR